MNRRWMTRASAGAAAAAAALALSSCGGPGVTASRVDDAIGPAFAHLYAQQQSLLGKGSTPPTQASADCHRTNGGRTSGRSSTGPGNDWICQLLLQVGNAPSSQYTYDLTVQANGCYTADGPQALVGGHTLQTPGGEDRVNPLFIIDGCFET